jgi:AhpD family alkylhydroperoxidase
MSQIQPLMTEAITELVAIGAAVASNCEPCFRAHYDQARKLDVSVNDMRKAVEVALTVKAAPHRKVVETAERYLASDTTLVEASSCCSKSSQGCC